jgi:GT2 family glycosyltransferase/glycosyltransferase involved in cell wall biosynthesis
MIRKLASAYRFLPRLKHVLKTEGPLVALRKIQRRLRTTPLYVRQKPDLLSLETASVSLELPAYEAPAVSIVIPVFNALRFTYHCLSALRRHVASIPYELIVVDDHSSDDTSHELARLPNLRLLTNKENIGFVRSCNRGAAAARGPVLVFLNNDTQAQPGWLEALTETFDVYPDAGLVGSRLLYPDGRQQEAGAIVFNDGSAWNYGHLDDPYKPEYSYVREPDYVSGASLAIRRELFERLGGFDEHFAPGYYEDADLAFRVRAAGFRVLYQPLSRVVHFEGVSAGRDENAASGMKRFQAINRQKFLQRWGKELASHGPRGEDLERQKERRVRRRAFVSDVYMLTPDKESGSLRMVNLIGILQELGFKVTFAAANLEAPEPYVSDLQMRGVEVLYRPYVKSVARHLKARGAEYELVILSRADTAAPLMTAARRYCPNARIVFDTVDLHFLREQRLAELTGDKATRAVAERRRREELDLIAQADTTLVVSAAERDLLAEEAPQADVRVISNIHQIYGSRRPFEAREHIFFIGAFAHPPNTDAVLWFCREIFPLILAQEPAMRFSVIGAEPPPQVRALASQSIDVLGHVPDVTPYFDGCRLSVAPLRYGAGVKGKINQSLAYGLPVAATSRAIEGMFLTDGESVLVADEPGAFAAAVLRLYRDRVLWQRLSDGGLAVMEAHFGFAAARRALVDLVGA